MGFSRFPSPRVFVVVEVEPKVPKPDVPLKAVPVEPNMFVSYRCNVFFNPVFSLVKKSNLLRSASVCYKMARGCGFVIPSAACLSQTAGPWHKQHWGNQRVCSFGVIHGSWYIKGTDESTLVTDSSTSLRYHNPSNLGSLILHDPDHPKGTHPQNPEFTNRKNKYHINSCS